MASFKKIVTGTVIGVATGLLSWQVKTKYSQVLDQNPLLGIAAYTGVFALLLLMVALLDQILAWSWNRFIGLRYWCRWLAGDLFFEGSWVDVGIDSTGSQNRLLNYSSINIFWNGEEYYLEGVTFEFHSGEELHWYSEHSELNGDKLSFWYVGSRYGSLFEHDKAQYLFINQHKWHSIDIEGEYGDANFKTRGRFYAISPPADRKLAAQQYLNQFQLSNGYDHFGFQVVRSPDIPHDERRWYRTFLRYSNKKQKETELLQRMIAGLPAHREICGIIDVGPADGEISSMVLGEIAKRKLLSKKAAYLAIEPSGVHLDSIETQIAKVLASRNFTFLKHRITDILPTLRERRFDLVLLANVLYYVPENDSLLKEMADLLNDGGLLLSLHDDFHRDEFLLDLLQTARSTINTDVVKSFTRLKNRRDLKFIKPQYEYIQILFPDMEDKQWDAVESGDAYYQDRPTTDATDLICFLVNRDMNSMRAENIWRKVVQKVHSQVLKKGTVELCATAQAVVRIK